MRSAANSTEIGGTVRKDEESIVMDAIKHFRQKAETAGANAVREDYCQNTRYNAAMAGAVWEAAAKYLEEKIQNRQFLTAALETLRRPIPMKIKDRYTPAMEVSDYISQKIDGFNDRSGVAEMAAERANNTLSAFARLVEVLHSKNVITLQELGQIVSGGELGIEAVERETDARGK